MYNFPVLNIYMRPALLCRLDAQDENHDHRVLGYTVYVGGQQRARVEGPLASQAELYGLDCTTDCHIQVWYVICTVVLVQLLACGTIMYVEQSLDRLIGLLVA